MRDIKRVLVLAAVLAVASAGVAVADQQGLYRVNDRQLNNVVNRIDIHRGAFRVSVARAVDRSSINGGPERNRFDRSVTYFDQAINQLRDGMNNRRSDRADVENVLRSALFVDRLMTRNAFDRTSQRDWQLLRQDMDELARTYGVAWNWRNPGYTPDEPIAGFRSRLTGTYQLESNQGDDPRRAAEQASRAMPPDQRQRAYQNLLSRLESPNQISIERNENLVSMASTRARRVDFDADGMDHSERWSDQRTMNTRATLNGERLMVVTTGYRGSDFTVTFNPMPDGRSLHVTRTIDIDGLSQPVTVRSSYRRLSDEARWDIDTSGGPGSYSNTGGSGSYANAGPPPRDMGVPDGIRFMVVLNNALTSMNSREGDLYTMTARGPSPYEGAVIQGSVSMLNESERANGRKGMRLNLQSIRLRNGRSYQFDGVIVDVRTPDGEMVRVDREGDMNRRENQTDKIVERSVLGAALGAMIGAVTGGGKGAVIGAAIGGGAGAGTVFIEGRDRLDLPRGTELTIISGDPRNLTMNPGVQR